MSKTKPSNPIEKIWNARHHSSFVSLQLKKSKEEVEKFREEVEKFREGQEEWSQI